MGAIELAARYERMGFGSASDLEPPFRHERAANLRETSDRIWTLGINWYVNRWTKIQGNVINERIEDTVRSPIPGRSRFSGRVCRIQFVL